MTPWPVAVLAARAFRDDPTLCVWLRARAGPVRDAWLELVGPLRKIPVGADDDALFGGLDVAATLAGGRPVYHAGLVADTSPLILPSAERCPPDQAGRLAQVLDAGRHGLIALDEGLEGEAPPAVLTDRLGLVVDLDGIALADMTGSAETAGDTVGDPAPALIALADSLGVPGSRAPLAALRLTRTLGSTEASLTRAVELTLAPRATRLPAPPEEEEDTRRESTTPDPTDGKGQLEDRVLDAVRPALPADLLAGLGRAAKAGGDGAGDKTRGNRRGRPLPARPGRPGGRARVDLVATLRTAAPWQRLRGAEPGMRPRLRVSDIRLRRHEHRSDRLVIFAVDASGSAAAARLAEAKGAVEILLGEAYARRDHVALIGFRGTGAEILLEPTRSLVRTKRQLAGLPGGGGTPLAAGLHAGAAMAHRARLHGMAPALVVLTDGRPNITLAGQPGRQQARSDAEAMARRLRADRIDGLVIDTGNRASPALADLARDMGATCLALPRADAHALGRAVAAAL